MFCMKKAMYVAFAELLIWIFLAHMPLTLSEWQLSALQFTVSLRRLSHNLAGMQKIRPFYFTSHCSVRVSKLQFTSLPTYLPFTIHAAVKFAPVQHISDKLSTSSAMIICSPNTSILFGIYSWCSELIIIELNIFVCVTFTNHPADPC